jgi:predicted Zn-dependent protease with MMP-like domain
MPPTQIDLSVWRDFTAPELADLEALAREEFARLPDEFRALCADLVIRVEEFASEDVLKRMGIEDAFDLMGLFEGIGPMPNMVWLYRRPILDYWAENQDTLGAVVSHVLIHEIGHHFGLSDADMEGIEAGVE